MQEEDGGANGYFQRNSPETRKSTLHFCAALFATPSNRVGLISEDNLRNDLLFALSSFAMQEEAAAGSGYHQKGSSKDAGATLLRRHRVLHPCIALASS